MQRAPCTSRVESATPTLASVGSKGHRIGALDADQRSCALSITRRSKLQMKRHSSAACARRQVAQHRPCNRQWRRFVGKMGRTLADQSAHRPARSCRSKFIGAAANVKDSSRTRLEPPSMALNPDRGANCLAALFMGFALFARSACAGDIGLSVTMSPEAARLIRDWRRANGLPQPPEAEGTHATSIDVEAAARTRAVAPRGDLHRFKPHRQAAKNDRSSFDISNRQALATRVTPRHK